MKKILENFKNYSRNSMNNIKFLSNKSLHLTKTASGFGK